LVELVEGELDSIEHVDVSLWRREPDCDADPQCVAGGSAAEGCPIAAGNELRQQEQA
jgi:hypothetical protein